MTSRTGSTISTKTCTSTKTCDCNSNRSLDIRTPKNVHLSAFYKRSFAYYTVKVRMPVLLTNIIDTLVRNKKEIVRTYGEEAQEELKQIIGEMSQYKYELQTNKPIKPLIEDKLFGTSPPDVRIYNEHIQNLSLIEGHTTHFHTIWLLTECYMYRRIRQSFQTKHILKDFDYFQSHKQQSYMSAIPLIEKMSEFITLVLTQRAEKATFIQLIKMNLWGNKCDLSLSLGKVGDDNTLFDVEALDPYILCDHSEKIWEAVTSRASNEYIDIVFDNAGYEVFTDLCLADYMLTHKMARTIRFYVKAMPWFISDVMKHDVFWMLDQMKLNPKESMRKLGHRWTDYIDKKKWVIYVYDFWTLPFDFSYMAKVDPDLYRKLAQAKAVFFKGDLNYRKLFGELNWEPSTSVDEGLRNFNPTALCIIRTVKADIICGVPKNVALELDAKDEKWSEKGEYGVIQCSTKVVPID
ncbi:unnamed protein product [Phyllotreta striolata]|uniref:Sugar phosphate phosphatase n=1 Tax=Phyllotreta striolata TaxID=444603 RepID=A0A9N9TCT5_PHYSR|nr:unnamed protein product [Phyllotreta striolata]